MRTDAARAKDAPTWKPVRLFLWTAALSLLFGLIGLGDIVENPLRVARNSFHPTEATGDIVLVGVDDESLREVGDWPWPRARYARIIDQATKAGAKSIFLDGLHESASDPKNDEALSAALARSGRVVMPVRVRVGVQDGSHYIGLPYQPFREHTRLASVSLFYNYQHAVWKASYAGPVGDQQVPTFSSALAEQWRTRGGEFRIDYSIDPATIPYIRASDLLRGRIDPATIAGKSIIIAANAEKIGDDFWVPGHGRMAGAIVHALGAETLKKGDQQNLGFWPAWAVALASIYFALLRVASRRGAILVGAAALLLSASVLAEAYLVFVDVVAGLFAIAFVGARLGWLRWRAGGLTNTLTGLPNLLALRSEPRSASQALVAARIHNYAEIASTLAIKEEAAFVSQLIHRLTVSGGGQIKIFQGDEGIFAWLSDPSAPLANHLEALHSLFRSPLTVGGRAIDVALSFGVELGSARSAGSRLGSALVAADEAWNDGLKWKYHDPARQEEAGWRLSLLGQLDAAIDDGEVWVAYQPQLDLRSGQVVGAEALARWTHPEKGPISPSEFVVAAEQQGRIAKLTQFVLDRAVATAAAINHRGTCFSIAVNISARMLVDRELIDLVRDVLRKHDLDAARLTLELTETEAIRSATGAIAVLDDLRALGVRIAIDDYGTGLSTLDYLKKVPASELKIDQSFIKSMRLNRSDLIMVQSTIALAHSLGRTVVAEGVEDRQSLEQLAEMGCDVGQGFVIGRPMGVRELVQRLQLNGQRRVA